MTPTQRAQMIGDALLNRTATQAELNRLGTALATNSNALDAYTAMDATQKANYLVQRFRTFAVSNVQKLDGETAAASATSTAVQAAATAFAEAP
jgi:hypothetical protein